MRTLAIVVPAFWSKTKFEPVRAKFKNIKVVGVIGREPITAKHQYVFVNDRRVTLSLGESKRLNDLFSSSGFNDIDFRTKQPVNRSTSTRHLCLEYTQANGRWFKTHTHGISYYASSTKSLPSS